MKHKALPIFIVLMLLACVACASFETNTKNAIGGAGITYNQSMQAAADLKKQGKISDVQWAQIDKYGRSFYVAYNAALDAFIAYIKVSSADTKSRVSATLTIMASELAKVNDYVNIVKGGAK